MRVAAYLRVSTNEQTVDNQIPDLERYQILTLIDNFKRLGCLVVSIKEPWIDTPFSDVMYSLIAWVERYESERRSERTRAGLDRARREGKKLGRPLGSKDKRKRRIRRVPFY